MLFCDPSGDRKPQTRAVPTLSTAFPAIEPVKDMWEIVSRDSNSSVPHDKCWTTLVHRDAELNFSSCRRELDGVVEKDEEHLANKRRISVHGCLLEPAHAQLDAFSLGHRSRGSETIGSKVVEIQRLKTRMRDTAVSAGENKQVIHDHAQAA